MSQAQALHCPHCSGPIANDPKVAGQTLSCPHCRGHFQMPLESARIGRDQEAARENAFKAQGKLTECQSHFTVFEQFLKPTALEGLEFIEASLRVQPDEADYWNIKGLLLADGLGRTDEAISCLRKAMALNPSSIQYRQNLRNLERGKRRARLLLTVVAVAVAVIALIITACVAFLPSTYERAFKLGQEHRRLGSDRNAACLGELDRSGIKNTRDAQTFIRGFNAGYDSER